VGLCYAQDNELINNEDGSITILNPTIGAGGKDRVIVGVITGDDVLFGRPDGVCELKNLGTFQSADFYEIDTETQALDYAVLNKEGIVVRTGQTRPTNYATAYSAIRCIQ
jgi:hypothetical protein